MSHHHRSHSQPPLPLQSLTLVKPTPQTYWHLCVLFTQLQMLKAQQFDSLFGVLQVLGALYLAQSHDAPFRRVMEPLKQRETELSVLSEADKLHLRLASVLAYVQECGKRKLSIGVYSGLLCSLLREFKAGLLALSVSSALDSVLDQSVQLLKQDQAHTALLIVVERLNDLRKETGVSVSFCAFVREVLLPLIVLLKGTGEGPQIEVVTRVEQLVNQSEVLEALKRLKPEKFSEEPPSISTTEFKAFISENHEAQIFERLGEAFQKRREASKLTLHAQKTLLHRRCSSDCLGLRDSSKTDLYMRIEHLPGLMQRGHQSSPPTPFFSELVQIYEESLKDDSEAHGVPLQLPPAKLHETFALAPISGEDVALDPAESEISQHDHPFLSNFLEILKLEKEPDTPPTWELVCSKPNVRVYKKRSDDSPVCMIKAYCQLDYPPEVVFRAMVDVEVRRQWDKLFSELEVFDPHEYHDYLYYVVKVKNRQTPIGISRRDWVQKRTYIRDFPEPGSITLYFISEDHPLKPVRKGIVRALTLIAGQVLRPTAEGCSLTMISQNDIGGLVPKVLVNHGAARAPAKWVRRLNKGCKLAY